MTKNGQRASRCPAGPNGNHARYSFRRTDMLPDSTPADPVQAPKRPLVLMVYYTHTQQARRVSESMAKVLRERGCDVSEASIEFNDPKYSKNFETFPFRHAVFGILPLLWPQLRRKTGKIRIPDEAQGGNFDLVCLGSATWFFTTNMPMRSYLKSDEARAV